MTNYSVAAISFLILLTTSISSEWITIDDFSVTTWNQYTADRPKTLTTFRVTNYPPKYVRSLNNRIDTYTVDKNNEIIYFIMQQDLYGISKFFKYNIRMNQIDQTEQVQSFIIDHIQFNPTSNRLYAIIHDSNRRNYSLVAVDQNTLDVKEYLLSLSSRVSPMSGSYFNSQSQFFTYHAYDFEQDHTVLITLDVSNNATERFIKSKPFDFNVYGFGYIEPDSLVALWQYSIITPMVVIKVNEQTGKQMKNVTITPNGVRIAEGFKPFAMDFQNQLFYVLSWADDLSATYISKVNMQTMAIDIAKIKGQKIKDYIFYKRE